MKKIKLYFLSQYLNGQRYFIQRTVNGEEKEDKIKQLKDSERTEEYIKEVFDILSELNTSEYGYIEIYCMASYVSKKGNTFRNKWKVSPITVSLLAFLDKNKEKMSLSVIPKDNVIRGELIEQMVSFRNNISSQSDENLNNLERKRQFIIEKQATNCIFNKNPHTQNSVEIFIRGVKVYNKKEVASVALLRKNNKTKKIFIREEGFALNKAMLQVLIEAIKSLKQPCEIALHCHTYLGLRGGETNEDLKNELYDLVTKNNHSIIEIVSDFNQRSLNNLITVCLKEGDN